MEVPSLRRCSLSGRSCNQILTECAERTLGPAGKTGRAKLRPRAWFHENLESRDFFVPGALVIVRSIFLKGVGVQASWPQMLRLPVMEVVPLFPAVCRFSKTL